MAGYIFTLRSSSKTKENIKKIIENAFTYGVYSTYLKISKNIWNVAQEGTFADYLSMKEGDNVYFFVDRKIYGIGTLKNVAGDCTHLNFPNADIPKTSSYTALKKNMILNESAENMSNRFLCTFEPSPYFFKQGIDIDDILSSNPAAFKVLRVFERLSFIKIDDIENQALVNILLKRNEESIKNHSNIISFSTKIHARIKEIRTDDYNASAYNILKLASNNQLIKHEMALEAAIIDYIAKDNSSIFGKWDYLSHQVVASPFKPIIYLDKMDIFGYRYIPSFSTISKYLMIEIKKDIANDDVIHQAMKYVDWINQEYSFGDYNMISAIIVASEFPDSVIQLRNEVGKRTFTYGRRPPITNEWNDLKLIQYKYNNVTGHLEFNEV